MSPGKLILNRFNGIEVFSISEATVYRFPEEDEVELNFEIETDGAIQTLPENESGGIEPNLDFIVSASGHTWDNFLRSSFEIAEGDKDNDFVARIYYHEHQPVDNVEIQILEQDGDRFRVSIKGNTCDPRFYDDSKPRTQIEVDAWFTPQGA